MGRPAGQPQETPSGPAQAGDDRIRQHASEQADRKRATPPGRSAGEPQLTSRVGHPGGINPRELHVNESLASIERALPFRADFGFSRDGINITAGFGLSF